MDFPATPSVLGRINLIGHCPFCLQRLDEDPILKRSTGTSGTNSGIGATTTSVEEEEVSFPDSDEPLSAFNHVWPHVFRRYQNCVHPAEGGGESQDVSQRPLPKFKFVSKFQNGKEDTTDITTVDVPPVCSGCQDLLRRIQKTHKELYELRKKLNDHVNRLRTIICGAFDDHAAFGKLLRSQTSMDKTEVTSTLRFLRCLTEVKATDEDIKIEVKPESEPPSPSPLSTEEDDNLEEGDNELEAHLKTERMSEEEDASSDSDRDPESGDDDPDFSLDEEEMMEVESTGGEDEDEEMEPEDPLQLPPSPPKKVGGRKQVLDSSTVKDMDMYSSFEEIESNSLPSTPQPVHFRRTKKEYLDFCTYKCDICADNKDLRSERQLAVHKLEAHGVEPLICPVEKCKRRTWTALAHYKHIRSNHPEENPEHPRYECEKCKRLFKDRSYLNRHYLKVHLKQPDRRLFPVVDYSTYKCDICPQESQFQSESALLKHKVDEHGADPYLCPVPRCGKTFFSKLSHYRHIKRKHPGENPEIPKYECEKCKREYGDRTYLNRHYARAHLNHDKHVPYKPRDKPMVRKTKSRKQSEIETTPTIETEETTKKDDLPKEPGTCETSDKTEMEVNYLTSQTKTCFKCKHCSQIFYVHSKLKQHVRLQHPEVKSASEKKCKYCNKSFINHATLRIHYRKDHPDKGPHQCDICSLRFHTQAGVRAHHKTAHQQKRFKCDTCLKNYPTFDSLRTHKERVHREKIKQIYSCDFEGCTASFPTKRERNAHRNTHTSPPVPKRVDFECAECSIKFPAQRFYTFHMKKVHGSVGLNREHVCDQCGETFDREYSLKKHKDKRHNPNLESLKCEYCGVDCRHKDALKSHIKHVHFKKYACEICGRVFGRKQGLDMHMTSHTGDKPYVCHLCPDRRFRMPGNLRKHLAVHARGGWLRRTPQAD